MPKSFRPPMRPGAYPELQGMDEMDVNQEDRHALENQKNTIERRRFNEAEIKSKTRGIHFGSSKMGLAAAVALGIFFLAYVLTALGFKLL